MTSLPSTSRISCPKPYFRAREPELLLQHTCSRTILALTPKQSVGSNLSQLNRNRLFLAAVVNSLLKGPKCLRLRERVVSVICLNRRDVHKTQSIVQLERCVSQSRRSFVPQLLEDLSDPPLVLAGPVSLDFVSDHDSLHNQVLLLRCRGSCRCSNHSVRQIVARHLCGIPTATLESDNPGAQSPA